MSRENDSSDEDSSDEDRNFPKTDDETTDDELKKIWPNKLAEKFYNHHIAGDHDKNKPRNQVADFDKTKYKSIRPSGEPSGSRTPGSRGGQTKRVTQDMLDYKETGKREHKEQGRSQFMSTGRKMDTGRFSPEHLDGPVAKTNDGKYEMKDQLYSEVSSSEAAEFADGMQNRDSRIALQMKLKKLKESAADGRVDRQMIEKLKKLDESAAANGTVVDPAETIKVMMPEMYAEFKRNKKIEVTIIHRTLVNGIETHRWTEVKEMTSEEFEEFKKNHPSYVHTK